MNINNKIVIHLIIRRYDLKDEPDECKVSLLLNEDFNYQIIKKKIEHLCQIDYKNNYVIKLRRKDGLLVPYKFLLDNPEECFYADVCKTNDASKNNRIIFQDNYIESINEKLKHIESRIEKAEIHLPQVEWQRQAFIEETTHKLWNKITFLNKRFDDLTPTELVPNMQSSLNKSNI